MCLQCLVCIEAHTIEEDDQDMNIIRFNGCDCIARSYSAILDNALYN